jgi:lysine-N-methylase
VLLDKQDYGRLKAALAGSSEDRAAFERGCVRTPGPGARVRRHATLQRAPDGRCTFLAPDGLCSVHATHGAAALPAVCATYPRVLTEVGGRLSLTATLSCPEAARLCLLAEDAMCVDDAEPAALAGFRVRHRLPAAGQDPFVRHFPAIRSAFLGLLTLRDYPVASRLFFVAHLARRLDAARTLPGRRAQDAGVGEALGARGTAQALAGLDRECRAAAVSGALPLALVRQILTAMLPQQRGTRFEALVRAAAGPELAAAAVPGRRRGARARGAADEEAWRAYDLRRHRWEREFPARIERYLTNYAADYWMRDPFTRSRTLLGFVLDMLARVAVIRFLLFLHPSLEDVAAAGAAPPRRGEALDRAVVEVVYTFSRTVEHDEEQRALLHGTISRHRLRSRRALLELARF